MEITSYVDGLRAQMSTVAGLGGDEATALAHRLADSLESAVHLVIQQAICDAVEEISADLAPGGVAVRLRARALDFEVTLPPDPEGGAKMTPVWVATLASPSGAGADGEAGTARISFRPPEPLKARIEGAAEQAGLSVNAFLVSTLTAVLETPTPASRGSARTDSVNGWYR